MATNTGSSSKTQTSANQPRVTAQSLKKQATVPNLTYRQIGVKNQTGDRTQRSYARKQG